MAASKSWPCYILTFVICTSLTTVICEQNISNKRLCADRECKDTISTARALAKYPGGGNPLFLSFNPGDRIDIKSKSAGDNPSLWGGEVNGQRGYFPRTFVKEMRVIVPSPSHVVDTEGGMFFKDVEKPPMNRRDHRPTTADQRDDVSEKQHVSMDNEKDDTEMEEDTDETEIDEDLADDEREIFEGDPDWNEDEVEENEEPLEDYSIEDLDPYDYEEGKNRFDIEEYNAYIQKQQAAEEGKTAEKEPVVKEEERAAEQSMETVDDTEFENEDDKVGNDDGEKDQIANDLNQKQSDHGGIEESVNEERSNDALSNAAVKESRDADNIENLAEKLAAARVEEEEDITDSAAKKDNKENDVFSGSKETIDSEKAEDATPDKQEDELVEGKKEKEEEGKEEEKVEERKKDDDIPKKEEEAEPKVEQTQNQDPVTFPMDDEEEEDYEIPVMDLSDNTQKDSSSNQEKTEEQLLPVNNADSHDSDDKTETEKEVENDVEITKKEANEVTSDDNAATDVEKADNPDGKNVDDAEIKNEENDSVEKSEEKVENSEDEQRLSADVVKSEAFDNVNEKTGTPVEEEKKEIDSGIKMDENTEDDSGQDEDVTGKVTKEDSMLKETADQTTEGKIENKSEENILNETKQGEEHPDEPKENANGASKQGIGVDDAPKEEIGVGTDDTPKEEIGDTSKEEMDDTPKEEIGVGTDDTPKEEIGVGSDDVPKEEIGVDAGDALKEDMGVNTDDAPKQDIVGNADNESIGTKDEGKTDFQEKPSESFDTSAVETENEISTQQSNGTKAVITSASETKDSEDASSSAVDPGTAESQSFDEKDSTDKVEYQPPHSSIATSILGRETKGNDGQDIDQTLSSSQTEGKEIQQTVALESSMQETVSKPVISETPSLAAQQMITTELSQAEGTSTDEKSNDGFETIVEGGTTIILDSNGNLVTPAVSEEAKSFDITANIAPSKSAVSHESDLLLSKVETMPVSNKSTEADDKKSVESQPEAEMKANVYQSVDFNSRRVLSVSHQTQIPTTTSEKVPDASDMVASKEEPDQQQQQKDVTDEKSENKEKIDKGSRFLTPDEAAKRGRQFNEDLLAGMKMTTQDGKQPDPASNANSLPQESTTVPSHQPEQDIPQPPTEPRSESGGAETVPGSYETETVVGRKIDDAHLQEEENLEDTVKARQYYKTMFDSHIRNILIRLPPSIQNLLEQEPLGMSPTMAVVAGVVSMAMFFFTCLFSCLCSSGGKKANFKRSLDVIQVLEEKLQLAIKEKENIEDSIEDNQQEVIKMKEETAKAKRENGKMTQDLQNVKLHNETMKKQIKSLEEEIEDLKENAHSSQGEVKQSNKKTKEMQKYIKNLEEKEQKATQEIHQLSSELKSKEEEVTDMSSRLEGMGQHVSQLETSKEQLLAEAEDWKEKVNDLNERWDQREEEFKQMQESLSFKESELEVLKDCFLQLKSFESEEGNSSNVEEKLQSMMDVSKINATLRSVEEERDSLSNKLQIESEARKELEEQMEKSQERVESCMSDKMKAERQCQEAQTKLSVLSSYFKEKEMQLQRELGEQEALKKQNQNKLVSADETTKTVQQESEAVRTQNESLKRELANSERDFRAQIAANEKKAHENWLAARAAERELKETRHEAGVLRQKLTDLERRQMMGPGGLIRPLPTRGMPPPGMMNGPPPPPGMDRSSSRGSLPHPPHPRDEDFPISPRGPPPPMDRRGPPPHGMRPPPHDGRSPPPRLPPHDARSPPPRIPPPGMMDGRGSPPFDRRPPPPHLMDRDRMTPPFRLPPPDMLPPPHMRDGPPPPHPGRGGSMSPDSPHGDHRQDPRYRDPYRNAPPPDRGLRPSPRQPPQPLSPRQPPPDSPRQQQSQV